MANKPQISVIIPNWNGVELLTECLTSLKKQTLKNFEVVVVDNGSTDNSLELLNKKFPEVKIVKLRKNFGFSKAINEGVKAAHSNNLFFLNNDTSVDKRCLEELIKVAQKDPGVVSVNCKILNYFDRKKIDGLGIVVNEVGQARSLGYDEVDKGQYDNCGFIFGATGGAALFKKDLFEKIGRFDEDYFMYSEEVDFAFRAQFLGYRSLIAPKAIVYHKHKASSKRVPQKIEFWQYRNMFATIIKDYPTPVLIKNLRILKITLVYLNTFLYQIKNGFYWPPILTFFWLLSRLPKLLSQRSVIQRNRKTDNKYIEQFLLPKKITFWGLRP